MGGEACAFVELEQRSRGHKTGHIYVSGSLDPCHANPGGTLASDLHIYRTHYSDYTSPEKIEKFCDGRTRLPVLPHSPLSLPPPPLDVIYRATYKETFTLPMLLTFTGNMYNIYALKQNHLDVFQEI